MAQDTRDAPKPAEAAELQGRGLFRTVLAGPGHTLEDAFDNLERNPLVQHITRHATRSLLGARVALAPSEGEGYWDFTRIRDEVYVIVQNYSFKDPRVELMGGDGLLQFNFRLSGDTTLGVVRKQPLRLTRPSLFIWNQPRGTEVSEWIAPSAHERAVSISVRPNFLIEHLLTSRADVPEQLKSFVDARQPQANYLQLPLTAHMFNLASQMVNHRHTGALALVYVEAMALQLLCEAMLSFSGLPLVPDEQYTERELRCLNAARDLLMRQFSPPPTIRQVARAAGMNETTLKRSFKSVFGETVADFGVRCRMQYAVTLLRDKRLPAARVAETVGYRHQTSFATAFRRHIGVRPRDVMPGKKR
jgi:AraC-like DNA-binding protein